MRLSNVRGNLILSSLSAADYERLAPQLVPVSLKLRQCLEASNRIIRDVYFPCCGIVSVVAISKNRHDQAEVGLIGWEGMTGLSVVLGTGMSPMNAYVQVEGDGQRIGADQLRQLMAESATLRDILFRYVQVFSVQAAYTGLVNARASINQRLARWLLMAHDRIPGDELHLTHEFLSLMLGVRRAGVTVALHALEAQGHIGLSRGTVQILNREGLVEFSTGFYGGPEDELKRLFPRVSAS